MELPDAPSCRRNRKPILDILKQYISLEESNLLEIGSGTGQHATYFAPHFKQLKWHTSDLKDNFPGICAWIKQSESSNIVGPFQYEAGKDELPLKFPDYVFSANTLHIMSWKQVKTLIRDLNHNLREGAQVFFYGPFNYNGQYTSESNAIFDVWLKERNPLSGIRHFEDVLRNMNKSHFDLTKDHEMPSNNRLLVFTKIDHIIKAKD